MKNPLRVFAVVFALALAGFVFDGALTGCGGGGGGGGGGSGGGGGGTENPVGGPANPAPGGGDGSAGGGPDGGGALPDTTPPTIVSVTPANGAVGVEPTSIITVVFSEPMNQESGIASFSFIGPDGGSVDINGGYDSATNTATFTPRGRLTLFSRYQLSFSTDLTDVAGNHLAAPYSWGFTVRDGVWEGTQSIDTEDLGAASYPQVAVNAQGNAVVIWLHARDGDISSNYYSVTGAGAWGVATPVETADAPASSPDVSIGDDGNAIAAWVQPRGDGVLTQCIKANQRTNVGWGVAKVIESCSVDSSNPQVAAAGDGRAVVVWLRSGDVIDTNDVYSNYLLGDISAWSHGNAIPITIGGASVHTRTPSVAMNKFGFAIAVWENRDRIYYNGKNIDSMAPDGSVIIGTWREATTIDVDSDVGGNLNPKIEINSVGNVVAAWEDEGHSNYSIVGRLYINNEWAVIEDAELTVPSLLDLGQGPEREGDTIPTGFDTTIDRRNNVISTYIGATGNVTSRIYNASTGVMGAPILIGGAASDVTCIGSDINGNAFAVWHAAGNRVGYNRYRPDLVWSVDTDGFLDDGASAISSPQLAVSENGMAVAVWIQGGRVVARVFR